MLKLDITLQSHPHFAIIKSRIWKSRLPVLISPKTHPAKFTLLFLGYTKKNLFVQLHISEGLADSSLSCLLLCFPDASADVHESAKSAPCLTFTTEEGKSLLAGGFPEYLQNDTIAIVNKSN